MGTARSIRPLTPAPDPDSTQAERWIRRHFRHHSRTFSFATRLLPREVRSPVAVVYLYCRTIDDIADEGPRAVGYEASRNALDEASGRLEATLAGRPPDDLLWKRLARVVHAWSLEPKPFRELIEGARWDLDRRPITDVADLVAYSELVAGSIGEMVLPFLVKDRDRRAELAAPARRLGVAMQITNILRDVGEDRRVLLRSYLPTSWLAEAGLSPDLEPDPDDSRYHTLIERIMSEAEERYASSLAAVDSLPRAARLGIRAAGRVYREILNEIRENGYDNVNRRAVVPYRRKLLLVTADRYEGRRNQLLRSLAGQVHP